ncbi:MAG: Gfo/Idh/MocA family oxidoreductase [Sphaerochaetaceae bacterium]
MRVIEYGIVGFGGIAENRVAKEGFALDKKRFSNPSLPFVLRGATDLNVERKVAAQALGINWYDSYQEMLADPAIQAIYVATSNGTHFKSAMDALRNGKHVLIEKPMTTTAEDGEELVRLAAQKNLSVSVNLMMSKNVYNLKTQQLLKQKALGEDPYAVFHMEFLYGSDPSEAATWRCSNPAEVGGPIGDVGGHCLDMAEFLFQEKIKSVRCTYYPKTLDIVVEDGAFIAYELDSGLKGSVRVAFNQPRGGVVGTLQNLGYEIYGELGIIRGYGTMFQLSGHSDEPVPIKLELQTDELCKSFCLTDVENIYQAQIKEHALSILNNRRLDGSQGLRNIKLVLACHESALNGGREVLISHA